MNQLQIVRQLAELVPPLSFHADLVDLGEPFEEDMPELVILLFLCAFKR